MRAPFRIGSVEAAVSPATNSTHAGDTPATTVLHSQRALVWFSCGLLFPHTDGIVLVHVRFRQNSFHFAHRDQGKEANEEEEEREENSVGADEGPDVDPGRNEQAP